ncbi:MAG: thiamine pyrophosphate-dependent enzyme, partial [Patescibacteria group bacterium]
FLMANLKKNQRLIANIGFGGLGYDLPAAIGACIGNNKKMVTLTVGDGSIQFNIQELQTIITYKLPIKIFVYDNKGYLSIKNTQKGFFGGNFVASDNRTGVICPDMEKIAKAYGIPAIKINNHNDLKSKIEKVYDIEGPVICILNMAEFTEIIPKTGSVALPGGRMISRPMEDMYPYLTEKELKENMIVKPIPYK